MVQQIINPARQTKKRIMKTWGMKSGKQYRKWLKRGKKDNLYIKYKKEK